MLFELDFQSPVPIYKQIRDQVVLAVAEGRLLPGAGAPPPRPPAGGARGPNKAGTTARPTAQV